jgi:phospholipid N-methyltransferase
MSRSYSYYDKQQAGVKLAHALRARGWKVYGYKADESDSMTDYWSPAYCEGIFTKNGFTLCFDIHKYDLSKSGQTIYKYSYESNNINNNSNSKKIEALKNMTVENGATPAEAENAKARIEQILNKQNAESDRKENSKVIDYVYPTFQENPGRCTWHIEKDGAIFAKGTNIFRFSDLPYEFNEATGEINNNYYRNKAELTEEEKTLVNDFKAFILKLERIINSMNGMGDGTAETSKQAEEQQQNEKMEKVIEKVTKKVWKMVEVKRNHFKVGDYITFPYRGGFWKITDEYMQKGTWKGVTESRKAFTYEIVGSASRGYKALKNPKSYYNYEYQMLNSLEDGKIKIYELKEVEEVTEVEKWVRVKAQKTTKKESNKTTDKKVNTENSNEVTETTASLSDNEKIENVEVKLNDEKNGVEIYFTDKPSEEVRDNLKSHGFRWSKYNKCWYAKQSEDSLIFANSFINTDDQESNTIEITEQDEQTGENLLDYSSSIIESLQLARMEYINNDEYKKQLIQTITDHDIKLTKGVLQYLHNESHLEFEKVLNDFLKNELGNRTQNIVAEQKNTINYEKLISKINKQIESNNNQIEKLSGNYLTNTWKRMKEQDSRDQKRYALQDTNKLLSYLINKCNNKTITLLEQNLIVNAFRNDIQSYYHAKYGKYHSEVKYPEIRKDWDLDNWYNLEVPKKRKRLQKANINNTSDLIKAVEEYKIIINEIEKGNSNDIKLEQIKKLEREYKMQQCGDVNFTSNKDLLNTLLNYADIQDDDKILEPSAGIGFIADKIKESINNTNKVDVCEYSYSYAELLKLKGYNVLCNDFLELHKYNEYDKIIANPPFSNEQTHIKNMYNMLKCDGRLVTICSPHWTFANDKQSKEFRNWLNNLDYEVYDVPENSFEFTNVNCRILIINKNESNMEVAL